MNHRLFFSPVDHPVGRPLRGTPTRPARLAARAPKSDSLLTMIHTMAHATRPTPRTGGRAACVRAGLPGWLWRGLVALAAVALVGACSSAPPVPDWQINARDATQRATVAHLEGRTRVAEAEFARARREAARSARADAVARVELARCAAQVASLDLAPCEAVAPLQADMGPPQQAYQRYLAGQPLAGDVPALPAAQQPVAQWLLAHAPGATGTPPSRTNGSASSAMVTLPTTPVAALSDIDPAPVLQTVADPLSRLVAAGVLMQAGHNHPAVWDAAVQAASDQGWTRPLLAWLGWQLRQAQARGDAALAQHLQWRLELLAPVNGQH